MMHVLRVGKPYLPGRGKLAPYTNYNFRGGLHELLLLVDNPTPAEIEDARRGESEFALVTHRRVIFFLYRFGQALRWSDCPYSIWLLPEAERVPPEEPGPESRALLQVILADADRNRVEAFRAVSLAPEFTRILHSEIAAQLAGRISIREYEEAIREAYARWPDTSSMLSAARTRAKGGA